jgi:phosphate transport system substrate-binding protein
MASGLPDHLATMRGFARDMDRKNQDGWLASARAHWRGFRIGAVVVLCLWGLTAEADVQGAGASFPSKVYERWAAEYGRAGGGKVRYQASGSGDGVKRISERQLGFAGTDTPLSPAELKKRGLIQLPTVVGGIVPVVNLPGVGSQALRLSGELLAQLMAGQVAQWNDARLVALNPQLASVNLPVRRVVRADKSGTTEGFTRYLALMSPAFQQQVGASQLPAWPGSVTAADGNDGVVAAVKAQQGTIGYVSFDRVQRDRLAAVRLKNAAGEFAAAGEEGFRAAIRESDVSREGNDQATLLNRPGPAAWPLTMTTYVLVEAEPASAERSAEVLKFLYWSFMRGDKLIGGSGFAPLPVALQSRLAARFMQVRARDGRRPEYLSL